MFILSPYPSLNMELGQYQMKDYLNVITKMGKYIHFDISAG